MMWKKLRILFILVVLSSFAQAKDECPLECDCSDDFSVVKCREMETFPVFSFASKVKTLDLTYGNIKTIHENEVMAYTNLENLFISHNPLDCNHVTTHTLKHVLRETLKLKSFDGHKIKCPQMMPIIKSSRKMAASNHWHQRMSGAGPSVHFHSVNGHCLTPVMVAGVVCLTILGLLAVAGLCWVIVLLIATKMKISDAEDPVSQMEEGRAVTETCFPENAIVDSEDEDVVEQEDYLRGKMKRQRRLSQGYADGAGSSDEESAMVEVNLKD